MGAFVQSSISLGVDPAFLECGVTRPDGMADLFIYGTDAQVARGGVGEYTISLPKTLQESAATPWIFYWTGTGIAPIRQTFAGQATIYVPPPPTPPPPPPAVSPHLTPSAQPGLFTPGLAESGLSNGAAVVPPPPPPPPAVTPHLTSSAQPGLVIPGLAEPGLSNGVAVTPPPAPSPPGPTPTLAALRDTTLNIHLAQIFGAGTSAGVDWTWGASGNDVWPDATYSNTPSYAPTGGAPARDFYIPYGQDGNITHFTMPWFTSNHPEWLLYKADTVTPAWYSTRESTYQYEPTIDYTNPAVQQFMLNEFIFPALAGGYTGISWDDYANYNLFGAVGHWTGAQGTSTWVPLYSGAGIDATYANAQAAAMTQLKAAVHARYPNANFTLNCRWDAFAANGQNWDGMATAVDMILDEGGFLGGGYATGYEDAEAKGGYSNAWLAKVQKYEAYQKAGRGLAILNQVGYTWTTNLTTTSAQAKFDVQWTLANYLLIKYSHTYFWMGQSSQYGAAVVMQPEYSAQIGSPTVDFYASQNVYMRNYTNGLVVVNPAPSTAYTITLPPSTYKDLYGNAVTTPALPAHSGLILLNV